MDDLKLDKPVRKIGITNRSVSGVVPKTGQYESSLERDFMEICRFDDSIAQVVPQPVTIPYETEAGDIRSYTPDGIIYFESKLFLNPILYEIKYIDDFRKDWRTFLPKFRAGKYFAEQEGWEFRVFTEKNIRTIYLENVKFLWRFKNRKPPDSFMERVLSVLADLTKCDPDLLLHILCKDSENRARMIPVIWYLVANKRIGCDLDLPLTMHSKIWMLGDYEND